MIRRFIGRSEVLLSVIGLEADSVLAADDPQAVLDAACWSGVDWLFVPVTLDADHLAPLVTACPRPPRCLLAASDHAAWQQRRSAWAAISVLGACLETAPESWSADEGLLVLEGVEPQEDLEPQALLLRYGLFDAEPREGGLLDRCFEQEVGALARGVATGLERCPQGLDPEQWGLAMQRLDVMAQQADTTRLGLAIGVVQATPGMSACLLAIDNPQAAAALVDYGAPAKSKVIDKVLRCITAMRAGQLQPPDDA